MNINPANWPINEDIESEFRFWARGLQNSVGLGAICALAFGLLIAALPKGIEYPGGEFARNFWPYLVEVAFWLGMFAGLLWGGSQRLGMALAATLPWQEPHSDRESTGRFFGQWAVFAALLGFFLWLAHQLALGTGMAEVAAVFAAFTPIKTVCWIAAGLYAAVAIAHRRQSRPVAPLGERSVKR
ncbi:hypothetical protein AT959_07875 [Dechloromonas denitrificans]|uniref:Uncharacterized protein n=1 Tax=Dechloromonas denitrificans TaxID=281362 RepID=A0A133XI90_9RHOO|nr:hypothetical protein [Dechloromonas denitrificans]KXB30651.1 hypothetical protein AT959_07875 [Dechloromonas denitrificans]